jgi:hypothetical protein
MPPRVVSLTVTLNSSFKEQPRLRLMTTAGPPPRSCACPPGMR